MSDPTVLELLRAAQHVRIILEQSPPADLAMPAGALFEAIVKRLPEHLQPEAYGIGFEAAR